MEISELGEFGLIDRLTSDIHHVNTSTLKGVGDDCAIINQQNKMHTLVTTDLLLEGVHFDLTYVPLKHLGYKAAQVNFSDIYAMGGRPTQIIVSLGISKRFEVEDLEDLYAGLRLACENHGVDIVGGDTSSSMTGLTINITCIGEVEAGNEIMRSGAKDTDLICITGNLGAAYMGLQLFEREKSVYYQQLREWKQSHKEKGENTSEPIFEPDFAGKEYLLERQLKPEARKDIIEALKKAGIKPTSMIDISDGLSSELMHICQASDCGCRIYEERIPLDYQTAVLAEEFNMNVYTAALNGGEDYELLFTVPLSAHETVSSMEDVKVIGHITRKEFGKLLVTRDGGEHELKAQGWKI